MHPAKRIFVNTIAQYTRTIINACLSLYTVRLILQALGQSDYGLFALVAGIVAMLGFMTNAMVVTTQRHLSFYFGKGNSENTRIIFSNSILLHLAIVVFLIAILFPLRDLLFSEYFHIEDSRRVAASLVYVVVIGMLSVTMLTAPFKALFIAHENIVYLTIIDVLDGILKLIFAILLINVEADKLVVYSYMLLSILIFQFFALSIYGSIKYKECQLWKAFHDFSPHHIKELLGFAGWTTYGTGAIMLRSHGITVVWNLFFNTIVNAAYGVAHQLFSAVSFVATSVLNAMNPQIMKAEGVGDRAHMLKLATMECKIISAMMAILFIPICFELPHLFQLWLDEMVPPYSVFFGRCLLAIFLIDQITYGLHSANQAVGTIRNYTLLIYTPKVLFLLIAWLMLHEGCSIEQVMAANILVELLVSLSRIPITHHTAGLDNIAFIKDVIVKLCILIVILFFLAWGVTSLVTMQWGFFMTIPLLIVIGVLLSWFILFDRPTREYFMKLLLQRFSKHHAHEQTNS